MKIIVTALLFLSLNVQADFQLIQLGTARRDQYLLNTKTGELRQATCFYSKPGASGSDCEYVAWAKVDVEGVAGTTYNSIVKKTNILESLNKPEEKKIENQDK